MRQCYCKTRWSTNPAMIYNMAPKHVLDLLLKGPQLVSIVTIHTKTVSKQSILTQREQLQRRVDVWGLDNSQALFIACSNDVYLFQWETDFRIRTMPWSIFNRVHIKHMVSGEWKGGRGKTEEQRISHSPKRNLQERKVRSDASVACFAPRIHACIQTHVILTWTNIGSYSMYAWMWQF